MCVKLFISNWGRTMIFNFDCWYTYDRSSSALALTQGYHPELFHVCKCSSWTSQMKLDSLAERTFLPSERMHLLPSGRTFFQLWRWWNRNLIDTLEIEYVQRRIVLQIKTNNNECKVWRGFFTYKQWCMHIAPVIIQSMLKTTKNGRAKEIGRRKGMKLELSVWLRPVNDWMDFQLSSRLRIIYHVRLW